MAGRDFRYIQQAARIADELDARAKEGHGRSARDGDRGSAAGATSREPIRIDITSAVFEYDSDVAQELAIRKALLTHQAAQVVPDEDGPDVSFPDREAGAALLVQMLADDVSPKPVPERTWSAFRRHLTVLACVLAVVEGNHPLRCPRQHEPREGWPALTVIPGEVLDRPVGLWTCVHPECDDVPGVPRNLNVVDEALAHDPKRLVTLEEIALFLGISLGTLKSRVRRAREAGYDLPLAQEQTSAKGQKQKAYPLAELATANSIGREIGIGLPPWPPQTRRRRKPKP